MMQSYNVTLLSGEDLQKLISFIPPQKIKEVFPDIDLKRGILLSSPIFVPEPTLDPIENNNTTTSQVGQEQDSIKMTTPPVTTNPDLEDNNLQSTNHFFESDPVEFSSIDAIYDYHTYDSVVPDGYYSVGILGCRDIHCSLLRPESKNQIKEGRFNTIGEFQMMMMNLDYQETEIAEEEEDKHWLYNIPSKVEEGRDKNPHSVSDHSSQVLQIEPDLEETNGGKNCARDTLLALQKNNLPSQQQQQSLNENIVVDEEETEDENVSIDSEGDQFHVPYFEIDEAADSVVSLVQYDEEPAEEEIEAAVEEEVEEETEDEDASIDSEADQFHVPYFEIDEAADSTASLVEHGEDEGAAEVEENAVPTASLVEDNDVNGATEVEENAASSSTENPINNPPTTTKKKKNIFKQLKYSFYLKLYKIKKHFRKPQYYDSDYDTKAREFYAYMRGQTPRIMYEYYTDSSESLYGR
ncbi:hypothetical protein I9W82_002169 [Candida metapsilosis]|uniref:Uncharacterized protein n=1 Tax=Candida metapsilosis TaxID=273372 RepID=A0A8H8DBZ2_9ASCO|nr:hypothetical protein I9W82_002169 [Candida metapsilosis]